MKIKKRVSHVFESSEQITFDNSSRFILMSDCHRGDGSWADNFSKNQHIYDAALAHYFHENYTYIEIGDGDELWENNKLSDIMYSHSDTFGLLSRFYNEGRLYFIFGNHDMVKKNSRYVKDHVFGYFSERENRYISLFENIKIHEGLVLGYKPTGDKIFLIHGHQVDFLNHTLWRLSRFLVKYLWRPLEIFGVHDPTSTAKNYQRKKSVEKSLTSWVMKEQQMLISGHTHRPMFPPLGEPPYFNCGSSVHPHCITGIEIKDGFILLVKWNSKGRDDGTMFIGREILAGPGKLTDYFYSTDFTHRRETPSPKE